jgi:hypothetical protein
METNPPWEINGAQMLNQISALLSGQEFCYLIQTIQKLDSILNQANPVQNLPPYFYKINFNITLKFTKLGPQRELFSSAFLSQKFCAYF